MEVLDMHAAEEHRGVAKREAYAPSKTNYHVTVSLMLLNEY
jgi:hypothetical protein